MNQNVSSRSSSRAELAALTEARIMEGVAGLLRRGSNVTFDLLAKESGVPQRTLYRYFENREALFSCFWSWANQSIEMPALPTTPEEIVAHIPSLFAAFDRDEALVRAMVHDRHGRTVWLASAEARRAKFSEALTPIIDQLSRKDATRLLASVTVLCSATGWASMKDNWQLSGRAAAEAAQWAVAALIDEARRMARIAPTLGRSDDGLDGNAGARTS